MAKIAITDTVAFDQTTVYETFRDHLVDLLPYLPDIQSITVTSSERPNAHTLKVVNLWKAAAKEIPTAAKAFIKPEMLQWTDYATWNDQTQSCDWNMEVGFLKDAVRCSGTTRYVAKGEKQTEITITGNLELDASKIPGIPRLLAGSVGDAVEKFVVKLITPNLTQVNRGLEKYLAQRG